MSKKFLENYILYSQPLCPFCYKVKWALWKYNFRVETRNVFTPKYKKELLEGGGKTMVPCLKHPDGTWQYESDDIIAFLKKAQT